MPAQPDDTLSIMVYQRGRARVLRYRLTLQFESEAAVAPAELGQRLDRATPDLLAITQEEFDRLVAAGGEQPLAVVPALAPAHGGAEMPSGLCLVMPPGQEEVDPRWLLQRLSRALLLSPTTGLLGSWALRREAERRLGQGQHFAFLYVDLDNFKAFNDHYGFERGDNAIRLLAELCESSVRKAGGRGDVAAHIGGDDFAILCSVETAAAIGEMLVAEFDGAIPTLYDAEDAARGCIVVRDRRGAEQTYPLISVSVAAVSTASHPVASYTELAAVAAELKGYAKSVQGSVYIEDRRRGETARQAPTPPTRTEG